jgi:hypothetical protein
MKPPQKYWGPGDTRTREAGKFANRERVSGKEEKEIRQREVVGIPTKSKSKSRGNDRGGGEYARLGKISTSDLDEPGGGDKNVNKP